MRVLVCGGRDYNDRERMFEVLDDPRYEGATLVHGDARGADRLAAEIWAGWNDGPPPEAHPADWDRYGKRAGYVRNQEMLDSGIDLVIAFPGGKGTAMMVDIARKAGVEVIEVED